MPAPPPLPGVITRGGGVLATRVGPMHTQGKGTLHERRVARVEATACMGRSVAGVILSHGDRTYGGCTLLLTTTVPSVLLLMICQCVRACVCVCVCACKRECVCARAWCVRVSVRENG